DEDAQVAEPGALMTHNVVEYRPRPERAESVVDAIAISLDETRRIDVDRVAELLDTDSAAARQSVLEHAFVDPESGELVSAVAYLSGDVRTKLEHAQDAATEDEQFDHNVRELEAVVPDDISIEDVTVNPGVHWVPQDLYNDDVRDTFEVSSRVRWNRGAEQWEVDSTKVVPQDLYNDFVRDSFEVSSRVRWNPGAEQWEVDSPKGGFREHVRFQWGTSQRTPAAL